MKIKLIKVIEIISNKRVFFTVFSSLLLLITMFPFSLIPQKNEYYSQSFFSYAFGLSNDDKKILKQRLSQDSFYNTMNSYIDNISQKFEIDSGSQPIFTRDNVNYGINKHDSSDVLYFNLFASSRERALTMAKCFEAIFKRYYDELDLISTKPGLMENTGMTFHSPDNTYTVVVISSTMLFIIDLATIGLVIYESKKDKWDLSCNHVLVRV